MNLARTVAWIALILVAIDGSARAQRATAYAGRPLAEVLTELQSAGLRIVFSSELVRPEMRVGEEPRARDARRQLDELLEPHGLRVRSGPRGVLLVVAAPRPRKAGSQPTGSIGGRVIDARTGDAIPGARVTVQGRAYAAVSGGDGTFSIVGVEAGTHPLQVSLVGYALARTVVDVPAGGTATVIVQLADGTGTYSEEITVVADRFRASAGAAPSLQVLTSADLQDLRGVIADDPLRAVQALPAIATGDDYRSEFTVRGSDFRHIGLTIDGVPVGWPVHTTRGLQDGGSVSIVNGDVLERATVEAGPYAQRYPGRTGAWLSLDLREGSRDRTEGHLAVSGSTSSVVGGGPVGRAGRGSWLFSARQSYLQWLIAQIDPDGGTAFGFSDVQGKLVLDVTPRHQWSMAIVAGRSRLDQSDADTGPNSVGEAVDRLALVTMGWRSMFGSAVMSQKAAALASTFDNTGRLSQRLADGSASSVSYLADVLWPMGPHLTARAGVVAQRHEVSERQRQFGFGPTPGSTVLRSEESRAASANSGLVHAGLAWRPRGDALIEAGASTSRSGFGGSGPVTPWLLASWPLARGYVLRAGVSRSDQFPDAAQAASMAETETLRPERARSVDVGVERRISPTLRWQATFYHRRERDVLFAGDADARLADGLLVMAAAWPRWRNALSGSARGVEVMVQRRAASGVSGWIGYSYGRARYEDQDTGQDFWADADQRHAFNAYTLVRLSGGTSVSSKVRLGSNFPLPGYFAQQGETLLIASDRNQVRLPRYVRIDARVNHAFTFTRRRLTLFVEVLNVTGHANYGPTDGTVRTNGEVRGFVEKLFPFLPSAGFLFEF